MDYEVPKGFTLVDTDDYEELLEMQKWADALQGAGVDGWDGYDYALEYIKYYINIVLNVLNIKNYEGRLH